MMDVPYSHHQKHYLLKKSTIYHFSLGYGRNNCWYDTYIHLSLQHQLLFLDFQRKGGGSLVTQIHLYQRILHDYKRNSVQSNLIYIHDLRNYLRQSCCYLDTYAHDFHNLHDYLIKSGCSQETYAHDFPLPDTLQYLLLQKFQHRCYESGRKNGWSYQTNILYYYLPSS